MNCKLSANWSACDYTQFELLNLSETPAGSYERFKWNVGKANKFVIAIGFFFCNYTQFGNDAQTKKL